MAWLALGCNRGPCRSILNAALADLATRGIHVGRVSSYLETAPHGAATGRARYLNAVAEVETALPPRTLLRHLQAIERAHGRHRASHAQGRKLPRTLDLDLIFYGRARIATAELQLPHPRWAQRPFVRAGLRELGHPRALRDI